MQLSAMNALVYILKIFTYSVSGAKHLVIDEIFSPAVVSLSTKCVGHRRHGHELKDFRGGCNRNVLR